MTKEDNKSPAAIFLKEVRRADFEDNGRFGRNCNADTETQCKIDDAVEFALPKAKGSQLSSWGMSINALSITPTSEPTQSDLHKLVSKLENICSSLEIDVPDSLRGDIAVTLLGELRDNRCNFYDSRKNSRFSEEMINLTLYQGNGAKEIFDLSEFNGLANVRSVMSKAISNYPSDIDGYLRKVMGNIADIESDDDLSILLDHPRTIVNFSYLYPDNPKVLIKAAFDEVRGGAKKVKMISVKLHESLIKASQDYTV